MNNMDGFYNEYFSKYVEETSYKNVFNSLIEFLKLKNFDFDKKEFMEFMDSKELINKLRMDETEQDSMWVPF